MQVRDASPDDAEALLAVWDDFSKRQLERFPHGPAVTEAAAAIARTAADPDERLLVGLLDNRIVGAVHLRRGTMSPIHQEPAIYASHLHVVEEYRRHGVGHALLEAATCWAEEKGIGHIISAVSAASRDANRFMARLGLAQFAIIRGATVSALRSKMPVEPPPAALVSSRNQRSVGQLIAQRRSMRRAQAKVGSARTVPDM